MLREFEQNLVTGKPWSHYKPIAGKDKFAIDHFATPFFTNQKALSLAEASKLSYSSKNSIIDTVKNQWGFIDCNFLDQKNSEAFIATTSEIIVIAFRGTDESMLDWLDDIDIRTVTRSYGKIHRGFASHYKQIMHGLAPHITPEKTANKKIFITGHSLGGAVATIAAAELKDHMNLTGIYTYGQPRVGYSELQQYIDNHYSDKFHRFVYQDDPVAKLPEKVVRDWQEVGRYIHLTSQLNRPASARRKSKSLRPSLSRQEFQNLKAQFAKIKKIQKAKLQKSLTVKLRDKPIDHKWPLDNSKVMKKAQKPQAINKGKIIAEVFNVDDHSIDNYIAALHKLTHIPVA